MINNIKLTLEVIKENEVLLLEGIEFRKCSYIKLFIDNVDMRTLEEFDDMLIVFSELQKSTEINGKFLIFTCACGIADDGGWEYVDVTHSNDTIEWSFYRNKKYHFNFNRQDYLSEFDSLNLKIKDIKDYHLIPRNVVYPEE